MDLSNRLARAGELLIDQQRAEVIVPPQRPGPGHWFGGGNVVTDTDGTLWLVGRYRNQGDSRTGLGAGERGLELALFRYDDGGKSFRKSLSLSKSDLDLDGQSVLSIEGSALRITDQRVELFVSTEKSGRDYPTGFESFLKPGTGVWSIDRIVADTVEGLAEGKLEPFLSCNDPRFVHVKDPFLGRHLGQDVLLFCTHPFCWSSSNSGFVSIDDGPAKEEACDFDFFPRGFAWDVAITRATALLNLPAQGSDREIALMIYDGGECVRDLDPHSTAVARHRGYSCEELGGLAAVLDGDLRSIRRLSDFQPAFVSPHATGCSRYVDVARHGDEYLATWQQAQADGSQPLVMNRVATADVDRILFD